MHASDSERCIFASRLPLTYRRHVACMGGVTGRDFRCGPVCSGLERAFASGPNPPTRSWFESRNPSQNGLPLDKAVCCDEFIFLSRLLFGGVLGQLKT